MAVPFDHQQLVVLGAAVPVVEGVLQIQGPAEPLNIVFPPRARWFTFRRY